MATEAQQRARATWSAGDFDAIAERIWGVGGDLVSRVGVTPGNRVLDVACGTGNAAIPAAVAGGEVTGLDITPELFEDARRRAGEAGVELELVEGDAQEMPFDDQSFDVVVSTFGCMFAPDHGAAAAEIARVLRPGGRAIFQEPVRNSPVVRFIRGLIPYRQPDISPFERPLTDEELHDFASPFCSVRQRAFLLPHVALGQILPVVSRRADLLYRSDHAIMQRVPALAYYAGIRVLELTK